MHETDRYAAAQPRVAATGEFCGEAHVGTHCSTSRLLTERHPSGRTSVLLNLLSFAEYPVTSGLVADAGTKAE